MKGELSVLDGPYDLIMMHHSLEHVADPANVLREAKRLLAPGGKMVVRLPVKDGFFWRTYGLHWAQIDPPRHLHLWTVAGFRNIARDVGLKVEGTFYDANASSFWGSELVLRGLTFRDEHIFTDDQKLQFASRIAELNERRKRLCRIYPHP